MRSNILAATNRRSSWLQWISKAHTEKTKCSGVLSGSRDPKKIARCPQKGGGALTTRALIPDTRDPQDLCSLCLGTSQPPQYNQIISQLLLTLSDILSLLPHTRSLDLPWSRSVSGALLKTDTTSNHVSSLNRTRENAIFLPCLQTQPLQFTSVLLARSKESANRIMWPISFNTEARAFLAVDWSPNSCSKRSRAFTIYCQSTFAAVSSIVSPHTLGALASPDSSLSSWDAAYFHHIWFSVHYSIYLESIPSSPSPPDELSVILGEETQM